jgi:nucleoside-diphosphate-sugar epimerase
MTDPRSILVTGGAGYVGSRAVPKLLEAGHSVTVLDLYLYGDVLEDHPRLTQVKGDLRDRATVDQAMEGCDTVIHLACISNDPSYELDPELGKSINYDAFFGLVDSALEHGVNRFVYASSSSVYGVKAEPNVTEDLELEPLTDYSKYKALCEDVLLEKRRPGFTAVIIRPATVCGYAKRLRLDVAVNILTNLAVHKRQISVFGGDQLRPNIHIEDMSDLYVQAMEWPDDKIDGQIFNAGYENHSVMEIAEMVKSVVGDDVEIVRTPTDDNRSYHISSEKIERELGFKPAHTIEDAVRGLKEAFESGLVPNSLDDPRYFNIKLMQETDLAGSGSSR